MEGNVLEEILKYEKIIIYGAHLTALECARWMIGHEKKNSMIGFAVTDLKGNPSGMLGFPVKKIEAYKEYKDMDNRLVVVIAMPEKYHSIAEEHSRQLGFDIFIKINLESMSKIKGQHLLKEQVNYPQLPFTLREDRKDVSWLDMMAIEKDNYYKFPTLFYLDEKEVFAEASHFKFNEDYVKICGQYRNLHMLPTGKAYSDHEKKITDIINVYAMFSVWDNIRIKSKQTDSWIFPVQVGSKLTDQRQGELCDDTGEHISDKNGIFAELTGAYWIWKNRKASNYKGLCHYRRHFMISEKEIRALEHNQIDVLLTIPRYVPGGIKNMFLAETPVKEEAFQSMLSAVGELSPDDKTDFEQYMDSVFYYPNNMVIARNDIYDGYCAWMFPILFRMAELDMEKSYGHETDRHIAYAAELLTSYFFIKNKDRYCIAVTDYWLLG